MATKKTIKSKEIKPSKLLDGLNTEQSQAVTFKQGPLLIIAGAGTGKTTVLTRRIVWLMEQKLAKPEEILALTFTEKAAGEMSERVEMLLPIGYSPLNICTFHSFAKDILSKHALDIGLPGDFKVITDIQAWMLIREHLYDFNLDYYKPIGNPNRFIHALLKHFGKAKGEEITPETYLKYTEDLKLNKDKVELDDAESARIQEVANAYQMYQKLLLDNSFLDFGDLINYTLRLFRERPKVLEEYRRQFKYVLVDEFQDTDLSQYNLVKLLASPENNITVVGDDDQSIYKFRGASIANILQFKQDYPKTQEITLTENYRSTQQVLDLAYNFIQQNNPERLESRLRISKKLKSNIKEQGVVEVIHAAGAFEEARKVVDMIIQLCQSENLTYNDFAILVRANDHADTFIAELSRRQVPFMFVANRGLYKKPLILDLIAYLKLLDNYHETDNLFRVLTIGKFKIDNADLINLAQLAKKRTWSLFEAIQKRQIEELDISNESNKKLENLGTMIERHTNYAREMPVSELLVRVLEDLEITKELTGDLPEDAEKRSLLEQFYRKTQRHEEEYDNKTVKAFLNQIKLEIEAGDQGELSFNAEAGPEAVKIMTIHASKGLEFAGVFVVNMVDQRFPSRDRKEAIEIPAPLVKEVAPEGDAHLMEERRLFYVAATRAKRFLFLTWADDYGGSRNKKPSRFLIELGLEQQTAKVGPSGEVFFEKPPKVIAKQKKVVLPDTFSFSHLSCFLHCPLEYKYKYVYHLPLPGEAQLSFGVTIHKTLEKFLQHMIQMNAIKQGDLFGSSNNKIQIPDKKLLQKFYDESWVDDWYADKIQKADYRKRGVQYLENFYTKLSGNPKIPKFLERPFKLKLGQYKFVGKIDRGDDNGDGTVDIVDYKTGQPKDKLSPVDKQQLLIYQWATQEAFQLPVKSLSYWYIKSVDDSGEFVGTNAEITSLQEKLLLIIEQILETITNNSFLEADKRSSHECKYRHLEG